MLLVNMYTEFNFLDHRPKISTIFHNTQNAESYEIKTVHFLADLTMDKFPDPSRRMWIFLAQNDALIE